VKHCHRPRAFALALLLGTATTLAAAAPVVIPLIPGLSLVHAVSERQGDYESTLNVEDLDADGVLHLATSADLPDPAGGKPKPVSINRDVSSGDRDQARTYKYMFSTGAEEYPGTTAMGTSAAVIQDLRAANQNLSARRAAAVRAALIPLGVAETRLATSGFGSSVPRDTNTTLAGRARNRRVELTRQ
jgi:hypothetical protein